MENLKYYYKNFRKENKKKVILISQVTITIVICGVMVYLIKENKRKTELLNHVNDIAIEYKNKYENAVKICERKDAFMDKFMSKLLREGNSEGARQMAYKRWKI